jgi:hypothetical protein
MTDRMPIAVSIIRLVILILDIIAVAVVVIVGVVFIVGVMVFALSESFVGVEGAGVYPVVGDEG